jgi:hypothetical protein
MNQAVGGMNGFGLKLDTILQSLVWQRFTQISNDTGTHAHAHAPSRPPIHPQTRVHACTHTHTDKYVILIAFPR